MNEKEQLLSQISDLRSRIAELEDNELKLKRTEEELKATNQQLQANEQQLSASNQQLLASEQQLKEANKKILKAKNQAEKDNERYFGLINNLDSGIVIHAADTSIINSNQRASQLLGLSKDQLTGKEAIDPQWQFIYEDGSSMPIDDYPVMRILNSKKPIKNQVSGVIRKNNDIVWLVINGIPILNNNEISEIIISFIDITQRKQSEAKLLKAKELAERNELELKKAQAITHIGSWYLDTKTHEVTWTEELYKMYGFDPNLPVPSYTEHMKLFTPESWEILSTSLAETAEKGIPYELELRTIRSDKSNGWLWARGEAVFDENKNIIGLWGAAQDISERKNIEEELRKNQKRYQKAQEIGNVGNWEYYLETKVFWGSDEAQKIYGFNPISKKLTTERVENCIPEKKRVHQALVDLIDHDKDYNLVFDILTEDRGIRKTIHSIAEIERDANGNPVKITGVISDITEQKKANDKLIALNQQLIANEQQLRATNQQLQANEQQLRSTNESLIASEKQFRNLFNSIQEGVYLHRILYDDNGIAYNYHIIEANPISEEYLNIKREDAIGKLATDLYGTEKAPFLDIYSKVAETGEPISFEQYFEPMEKYFYISVFSPAQGEFATAFLDITSRKNTEDELKSLTERHKLAIESAKIGVWDLDLKNNILIWDKQMFDLYGIKHEDFGGAYEAWKKGVHPEDIEEIDKEVQEAIAGKKKFDTDFRVVWPDGKIHFIKAYAVVIKDSEGLPERMIGINWDITNSIKIKQELIKAKEKAEQNEEQLKRIANNFVDGMIYQVAMLDENKRKFNYVSDAVVRLYGCTPEQAMKNSDLIYGKIHPEDAEGLIAAEKEALKNMSVFKVESRVINPDGSIRWSYYVSQPRVINKLVCWDGIEVDITKQKQSEQELTKAKEKAEESQANIKAIIEGTKNSIWAFNKQYKILYINNVFQQDFLQSFGVLLEPGMSLVEALPEPLQLIWKPRYDRVLSNEQFTLEDAVPTDKGTIYIQVSFNPIIKNGQVIGGSCIGNDITERKIAEIELLEAKEKAEESDRLKSAFLANMSHEIRTPMNGILGFTNLLQQPNLSGEKQQKYVDIIQKSGVRMLNTVNDIINISRIEAGLTEMTVSEVNIDEQLQSLYSFFKPEAEKKGVRLVYKNDLFEKDNLFITDPDKLNSIITNLIKNAIKFTDQGIIELGYNVKEENGSAKLEFYVKDSGIGIPKDRQEAIFERFVQADIEDKQAKQGSGLGLAISKAFAEMLGGKIWVESEEGKGSTFYFTIENNPGTETKSTTKNDSQIVIEDNISGKLNILVVEDDETSQYFITLVVENYANRIIAVNSGLEAIEICRNNADINLILMDIQLPGINGYETTREIRKFNKEVIIIAQTAYALTGDKEKAISVGCNDYVSKPIDTQELVSIIKKYFVR